jgi:integrase/recombinase XerD
MNSKQGVRYLKRRMGNDLKQKILEYNGVISPEESERKPSILNCPRCDLVNAIESKYCSRRSYPLVPSAFEELKTIKLIKNL